MTLTPEQAVLLVKILVVLAMGEFGFILALAYQAHGFRNLLKVGQKRKKPEKMNKYALSESRRLSAYNQGFIQGQRMRAKVNDFFKRMFRR